MRTLKNKKKTAILISGHARTIEHTFSNLKLLKNLMNADIFIHTWDEQEMNLNTWRKPQVFKTGFDFMHLIKSLEPKSLIIDNQNNAIEFYKKNSKDFHIDTITGSHYMVYGMFKSFLLIPPEEYDLIIRYRFDIRILDVKELVKCISKSNLDNKVLMSPHNWASALGAWFDGILIGTPKNYRNILEDVINNLDSDIKKITEYEKLIPELLICQKIEKLGLDIKEIPNLIELVREGNKVEQKFGYIMPPFIHKIRSHLKYLLFRMPVKPLAKNSFSYSLWKKNIFK